MNRCCNSHLELFHVAALAAVISLLEQAFNAVLVEVLNVRAEYIPAPSNQMRLRIGKVIGSRNISTEKVTNWEKA